MSDLISSYTPKPYLGAIKRMIEDAFPNSKIYVWAEDSIFDRSIAIKARVDNDGACTSIFPSTMYSEAQISALLIALLKERRTDDEHSN